MNTSLYQETIDWLFQQFPSYQNIGGKAYKPGLENIYLLLEYFENPQDDLTFVHVAGTNGKGSTCSMLASCLTEAGNTVGLFTSPHIQDFRERIRVNGNMVDKEFVIDCTEKIKLAHLNFEPSFFEISFLMSLLYFKSKKCNICVVETGLGGRLDATNSIVPIVSLITNISIEHTQFLGNTIEEIAAEKAGIIKPGVPVVIGETNSKSKRVFIQKALETKSDILFSSEDNVLIGNDFPLLGDYQKFNYKLVLKALSLIQDKFLVTDNQIDLGLKNLYKNTGFYGRLQVVERNPTVIYDVSHNEAGIKATLDYFKNDTNLTIVYGTSNDKDLEAIFSLFPSKANYFFTEFKNERSAKIEKLEGFSKEFNLKSKFFKNSLEALNDAKHSVNEKDIILVFGSFFLISDFFEKK